LFFDRLAMVRQTAKKARIRRQGWPAYSEFALPEKRKKARGEGPGLKNAYDFRRMDGLPRI
jgi:hypothetical protein